jgi:hypothetical protein
LAAGKYLVAANFPAYDVDLHALFRRSPGGAALGTDI